MNLLLNCSPFVKKTLHILHILKIFESNIGLVKRYIYKKANLNQKEESREATQYYSQFCLKDKGQNPVSHSF